MNPPSFASFPDLDIGPSKPPNLLQPSRRNRGEKNDGRKEGKGKERKRERHSRVDIDLLDERDEEWLRDLDDRMKSKDDRRRKNDHDMNTSRTSSPPLFYSDRKGDPLNVRYGGLHTGDVPKYHLVDRTKILGLDPAWTVFHRSGKGVEVGLGRRRNKMPGLTDPKTRTLVAHTQTRKLLPSSNPYRYEEIDGFLRLPSRRGKQNDQAHRSITSRNPDSVSQSSASEAEHSSSDSDTMHLTAYQDKSKVLDHQLTTDPSSIDTWLSLLSHSLTTIPVTSKNGIKARAEITLSILSRALSAHPDNACSTVLRLRYLKAGEEVWQESKLSVEWEEALKIGGADLWIEWLEWRIRKGGKGIDRVTEDGVRVLSSLDDEVGKVRLLWRLAVAFQHAGFFERAFALFQAQAELSFDMPQSIRGLPEDVQLDALEEFWESGVPLIGEPDAKGWSAWITSERPEGPVSMSPKQALEEESSSDPYIRWSVLESRTDRSSRLPSRSADEPDPYATILFSDVRPLLMSPQSAHAKHVFRIAWLSLLGLHIPGFSESLSADRWRNADDRWCYTHLTSPSSIAALFPSETMQKRVMSDAYAGVVIGREKEYASGFGPVKNWGHGVVGPLEHVGGEQALWTKEDLHSVDVPLARRIFAQLKFDAVDHEWDVLALTFEAAVSTKSALKVSRAFLSTARDSLPHWAAHARLERHRGRNDDARRVYQTVFNAPRSAIEIGTHQVWWDWAEMEWLSGDSDAALHVIARSANVEGAGIVASLRAKRKLKESFTALPEIQWRDREALIKLSALLELLIDSLDAASSVFDSNLCDLERGTIPHESLTVAHLTMLCQHGTVLRNPAPPSLLRGKVEKAMEIYPSNTIIIGMFLQGEKGQGVWGRVRRWLGEGTTGCTAVDKDVARRITEVWIAGWEKGRWEGEKERARMGLAAAIESERTRNSPIIWRIYIEFEIRAGQLQRAKKMLFRAIGECPLVKELYLLAFGPLRSVFSASELNGFSDAMAERGIRMRRNIDDFLDGWEENTMEAEKYSSGDDEIEHDAEELRRLKPY